MASLLLLQLLVQVIKFYNTFLCIIPLTTISLMNTYASYLLICILPWKSIWISWLFSSCVQQCTFSCFMRGRYFSGCAYSHFLETLIETFIKTILWQVQQLMCFVEKQQWKNRRKRNTQHNSAKRSRWVNK